MLPLVGSKYSDKRFPAAWSRVTCPSSLSTRRRMVLIPSTSRRKVNFRPCKGAQSLVIYLCIVLSVLSHGWYQSPPAAGVEQRPLLHPVSSTPLNTRGGSSRISLTWGKVGRTRHIFPSHTLEFIQGAKRRLRVYWTPLHRIHPLGDA